MITVKILPNDKNNPPGKLADAELHFLSGCPCGHDASEHDAGPTTRCMADACPCLGFTDDPLAGLKLIGCAIWERRTGAGRNVTFPARQYSINGERRSFALLRPTTFDGTQGLTSAGQDRVRELILDAYAEYEKGVQE